MNKFREGDMVAFVDPRFAGKAAMIIKKAANIIEGQIEEPAYIVQMIFRETEMDFISNIAKRTSDKLRNLVDTFHGELEKE